jgi:hypothetical protein
MKEILEQNAEEIPKEEFKKMPTWFMSKTKFVPCPIAASTGDQANAPFI